MSTQSPLPQNDPLLIAFQQLKHTPEYRNAVNWTIKAENENHADGELWFAFAAGWNAREALAATPADPVREAATALELPSIEDANQWKRGQAGVFISPELEGYVAKLMSDYAMEVLARSGYFDGRDCKGDV